MAAANFSIHLFAVLSTMGTTFIRPTDDFPLLPRYGRPIQATSFTMGLHDDNNSKPVQTSLIGSCHECAFCTGSFFEFLNLAASYLVAIKPD